MLLEEPTLLAELMDGFGSPLNVVLPTQVRVTAAAFRRVLTGHGVRFRMFLAHKANRSAALVRQAAVDGLDLDVASHGELCSGLVNGFGGSRMEATGPKNAAFLRLAVQHGLIVHVDNSDELTQLAAARIAVRRPEPVDVVLRIAVPRPGPASPSDPGPGTGADSKFGILPGLVPDLLARLAGQRHAIRLRGLAFHLTSGGVRERLAAFETLVDLHVSAQRVGLEPTIVNIGGGFAVRYLADPADWDAYLSALKRGLLGQGPAITWNGEGFGLAVQEGRIAGTGRLPHFGLRHDGPAELEAFLTSRMTSFGRREVATFLAENELELHLEPGRALLDQTGLTLARVSFVKRTPAGARLVGLDANASSLDTGDREFFTDPIVLLRTGTASPEGALPAEGGTRDEPGPVGAYLGGNLCHPGDLLTRHLTRLDRLPAPGDAVAFVNTAGYTMDFRESATLLQRTAAKVALTWTGGRWRWWRDEDYVPVPPDPSTSVRTRGRQARDRSFGGPDGPGGSE